MDIIKLNGILTSITSNLHACFRLFQVLIEGPPVKSYKIQLPVLFISGCFISIFTAAIIFVDALEFH